MESLENEAGEPNDRGQEQLQSPLYLSDLDFGQQYFLAPGCVVKAANTDGCVSGFPDITGGITILRPGILVRAVSDTQRRSIPSSVIPVMGRFVIVDERDTFFIINTTEGRNASYLRDGFGDPRFLPIN